MRMPLSLSRRQVLLLPLRQFGCARSALLLSALLFYDCVEEWFPFLDFRRLGSRKHPAPNHELTFHCRLSTFLDATSWI